MRSFTEARISIPAMFLCLLLLFASPVLSGCEDLRQPVVWPKYGAGCEERYQNIESLLAKNPLIVTHEVTPCNGIPEDTDHNTTIVTAELHAETTAAQANNLLDSITAIPAGSLAGGLHEGISIDITWGIKTTPFTLSFHEYAVPPTNTPCHGREMFAHIDQYAAAPGIQHVTANCTGVTLDHGDLPAFPSTFVAKRSDFPDTLGHLEETFTIGKWWKIIIHPHNGWEVPTNYPFDQLLKTIEGNTTNWRNVDDHWNPTPTTFNVRSYADIPGMDEEEEHATEETKNLDPSLSSITIDTLNGTDPGLDQEAAQRIGNFLNTHPGIKDARICGVSERGLFHGSGVPYYCYYWPSQEFGLL
ncbi:hypothetical protein [Schaalia sp. Marseille-Q2122]|uniref:hypothetical protein n=1 Tax=Schaalia sp. Marseille-Q2122 TaxID=2736604 RepID=UPI00158899D3|nr:hypothetical protein [Schaalia sp. Marseille-Q2122]